MNDQSPGLRLIEAGLIPWCTTGEGGMTTAIDVSVSRYGGWEKRRRCEPPRLPVSHVNLACSRAQCRSLHRFMALLPPW